MEKYLGNKTSLLPILDTFFSENIPTAKSISEPFAGTNNVSRYFSARGWNTHVCDSNRFSYVLANCYLGLKSSPEYNKIKVRKSLTDISQKIKDEFTKANKRFGEYYLTNTNNESIFTDFDRAINVLATLQYIGMNNKKAGYITNYFSQWGNNSTFISVKGTSGVRNYFSKENALFLDAVLETVRDWWKDGKLTREEISLILTSIIEEVVITANVSGTFHDFNRNKIWANANQNFTLKLPLTNLNKNSFEIANADCLDVVDKFKHHSICYLDPPYNFRQYNAYYHFLNFIAAYPFLEHISDYLNELTFVRGQNPKDDFTSVFCFKDKFLENLVKLIKKSNSEYIVLSYFNGRNHWNHWSNVEERTENGFHKIKEVFDDTSIFAETLALPILDIRKNYQSRVGEKKENINEYLFYGKLKNTHRSHLCSTKNQLLKANIDLNLDSHFNFVSSYQ